MAQEAELQRHRRRLVREGHIQELAGARLGGAVSHATTDSSANFEVCLTPKPTQRAEALVCRRNRKQLLPVHSAHSLSLFLHNTL
jgi:hypothetical protein